MAPKIVFPSPSYLFNCKVRQWSQCFAIIATRGPPDRCSGRQRPSYIDRVHCTLTSAASPSITYRASHPCLLVMIEPVLPFNRRGRSREKDGWSQCS